MSELLPSSLAKVARSRVFKNGSPWLPIFCANCGCDGGFIPEPQEGSGWAFYLCQPCADQWQPLADMKLVPDEVFWATARAEQLEQYGRELLPHELTEALKDDHHVLTKLARDRYRP